MRPYYKPMLARSAEAPFNSKDWIFEVKWDGIRAISYINDEVAIRSRNQKELKDNFPELSELKGLARNVVLDGEIAVVKDGKSDFQTLIERSRATRTSDIAYMAQQFPVSYVIFDILEKDRKTLVDLPLTERKRILQETLREGKRVVISVFVEDEGEIYYKEALKSGMEGMIAKKKDSRYEPGVRSANWLKVKKLLTCDCAIFGYTAGEGKRKETFGALILGLYDGNQPVYVGKVGTGFSEATSKQLMEIFKRIVSGQKTLEGVDVPEKITWVKPELVCEIIYQIVTKDNKLRMPRFQSLRTDKNPLECTLDQIRQNSRPVKLQEYTSKRDFTVTPEPKSAQSNKGGQIFVIQEHHARKLHYDLRLEKGGVLKSWAVPKGIPEKTGDKKLAVQTEDHPMEYASFQGTIPAGQYGAGSVEIWDKGTFEIKIWKDDMIEFTLKGERLQGKYVLTRFKKAGEKDWLLLKTRD
jgi:DNA ligase D-like protein (predicted ligase)/DNA ligase D-like protein (predicted 3'-phosphoesterase)